MFSSSSVVVVLWVLPAVSTLWVCAPVLFLSVSFACSVVSVLLVVSLAMVPPGMAALFSCWVGAVEPVAGFCAVAAVDAVAEAAEGAAGALDAAAEGVAGVAEVGAVVCCALGAPCALEEPMLAAASSAETAAEDAAEGAVDAAAEGAVDAAVEAPAAAEAAEVADAEVEAAGEDA